MKLKYIIPLIEMSCTYLVNMVLIKLLLIYLVFQSFDSVVKSVIVSMCVIVVYDVLILLIEKLQEYIHGKTRK